ncbi:MAG: Asp-tRNA(Asn)/Glu-tRNA(Gln) amidotransferase subunit GatA, partial [Spirochaetaceae bacterium]|nr:Asp-tRNA(Asn)/Glu-tRNA(Gln) amidotransferase subunit GatA [Spirochaetaceae bacterium]
DLSAIKKTNNPWDISRVAGGSSGGSAAAVAAGLVPFALGSDTGGSVRQPAAFCGVVGLKPTWGAVSRFGLVAYASSLETIGVFSDGVERCRAVFKCIAGQDLRDQNSENAPSSAGVAEKTIGVLSPDAIAKALDGKTVIEPAVERGFITAQEKLKALGYKLVPVEIPSLKYAVPAYYTIASAEASANLARFDGVRYGRRPEWAENPESLVKNARTEGFGAEVKLRVLLGTFVLRSGFQDQYYNKAQKIRSLIRLDFEKELNGCSAILMPVFPTLAFARGGKGLSSFEQKVADVYTCCANLAGLPALSFPASVEDGLPAGVQLLGKRFSENTLFDVALDYEKSSPFPHPEGWEQFWQSGAK